MTGPTSDELRRALTSCDREPIHVPGHVQSFGALAALSDAGVVLEAGGDTLGLLGRTPGDLLGRGLASLLGPDAAAAVRAPPDGARHESLIPAPGGSGWLHAAVHTNPRGLAVVELEPAGEEEVDVRRATSISAASRSACSAIRGAASVAEALGVAVDHVAVLTGAGRVMAYVFHDDGSGEVKAERVAGGTRGFLDHRFPASDIPAPARRAYEAIPLRLICDAAAARSPLARADPSAPPLDLSRAILRGLSPVHAEYLRNMGVRGSMSLSVTVDGVLWGLLACHASEPLEVPPAVRSACAAIADALSLKIEALDARGDADALAGARRTESRLMAQLAERIEVVGAFVDSAATIADLIGCGGAAVFFNGRLGVVGSTPEEPRLRALIESIESGALRRDAPVFSAALAVTDALARDLPEFADLTGSASGVLAVPLRDAPDRAPREGADGRDPSGWALWFRPELRRTVTWAGDPEKSAAGVGASGRLNPRASFEAWTNEVRGQSEPWERWELIAAAQIGATLYTVLREARALGLAMEAQRSAELRLTGSERALDVANADLRAFVAALSHDLREPIRHIDRSLTDLQRLAEPAAAPALGTAREGVKRLRAMTEDLVSYGRTDIKPADLQPVDLGEALAGVLSLSRASIERAGGVLEVGPMPVVMGDAELLTRVVQNLLSNAEKFAGDGPPRVSVDSVARGEEAVVRVTDRGVGIPEGEHGRIFELFMRGSNARRRPGTGVGLALCRRICGLLGGRIWAEPGPGDGRGTRMCVALRLPNGGGGVPGSSAGASRAVRVG